MAGLQQGEKQLFEKFWRGTFKAVATPRPESIIVASITARKPLPSGTLSCLPYPAEDRRPEKLSSCVVREPSSTNGCAKGRERWDHAHRRSRSPSCGGERPLLARGKKKKKKSGRKKRRRSPSYSPSPVKKKKKKSSKKRKRNRLSSKKRRHSSRGRTRKSHRHRRCHSRSESSDSHSPSCRSRHRARSREEGRKTWRRHSWHHSKITAKRSSSAEVQASQKASQTLPLYNFLSSKEVISQSGSSADLFTKTDSPPGNLDSQNGEYHEYDSGNDTSSPPSTQTSSSRSKDSQEKRSLVHDGFGHAFSSGKPKLANSDNSSDSGNSFTSCFSQTKGTALENLSPDAQGQDRRACLSSCLSYSEEKKQNFLPSPSHSSPLRPGSRSESHTSTGRSSPRSSRSRSSHHTSPRYSRSRSCSSGKRSFSRSPSYSSKSCKKSPGSRSSRPRRSPSYFRYSHSRDREREHKHSSSEKESHRDRERQRRRRSYSPLRKRRRDSPSHLEARRITSARKRPIPYYRPSPSSSSSASSYSSWDSSFSRSPSRSRSYSSYRTSRSRSWSSSSSADGRSRSRSSGPRSSRSRSRSYDSGASSDSLRR
ncbi:serine/arginine repetitive matrix protein 4 isoform X3 [Corvus hawaiiensis]|uniref:serine/arginine repetitive matrix protein 4 isoform X3 n=1 Tax=Corvus hawaiiensis TaxID=134902 RepID=UPI002018D7A7|nr:serine/arginine repetitive matrix protein 4 isoform X3 [Corvus hawaiiensis]